MAVFSVNQATQMYVGGEKKSSKDNKYRWYEVEGKRASEMIKESNIIYETEAKAVSTMNVKAPAPQITVQQPVVGAEYLIRLVISTDAGPQYAYYKNVAVLASSTDVDTTTFAATIVDKLTKAAKRDVAGQYYTAADDGKGVITISPNPDFATGKRYVIPTIEVSVSEITGKDEEFDSTKWVAAYGEVNTAPVAGSGLAKLKDLEYFCAGERGDVYRGAAWPNDIPFESKITGTDPTVTVIHYYEDLDNEAVQKSEKTIVLVANN